MNTSTNFISNNPILNSLNNAIAILDANGQIYDFNNTFSKLLSRNRSDLLKLNYWNLSLDKYRNIEKIKFSRLQEDSKCEPYLKDFILPNGANLEVKITPSKIIIDDKNLISIVLENSPINDFIHNKALESDNSYRNLIKNSPLGMLIISDGKIIVANESLVKTLGYKNEEEILGRKMIDFIAPDYKNIAMQRLALLFSKEGEVVDSLEEKMIKKDGTFIDSIVVGYSVKFEGKLAVHGYIYDITDRKKAELELAESEDRLRMMFENANAVMMLIDPETGKIVDANKTACDFYGYSHQTMINDISITDINTITDKELHHQMCNSVLEKNQKFLLKHKLRNGSIRDVEIYVGKIISNEVPLLYAIIHDITESRTIALENLKLSQAVMQSPASIVITDLNGNIEFANKKFLEVTGYTSDEVIGANPRILKSGSVPDETYVKMWETILAGNVWTGELLNKRKDGTFFWEDVSITPIFNSEGEIIHFLGTKEDITDIKKNEQKLIEAKEKAEQSDKLKSEFLAQMSHEIRTPVNTILSFSNLLHSDHINEESEEISTIFNSIDSASKRIIRTIEMIINMSEIQTGSYEVVLKELRLGNDILKPLISEYKMLAELRGIDLIYKTNDGFDDLIVIDEYSSTQILANLLDNAIKYTHKGFVKVTAYKDKYSCLTVEVSDSGIGMNTEYLSKLFLPFSQEEQGYTRQYDGNGLGLALVKNYCKLNNAKIEVKSEKNIGSTFIIKFNN